MDIKVFFCSSFGGILWTEEFKVYHLHFYDFWSKLYLLIIKISMATVRGLSVVRHCTHSMTLICYSGLYWHMRLRGAEGSLKPRSFWLQNTCVFSVSIFRLLKEPFAWDSVLICRHLPAEEPKGSWTSHMALGAREMMWKSDLSFNTVVWGKERTTSHSLAHNGINLFSKRNNKWEETDPGKETHGSWDFNLNTKEK